MATYYVMCYDVSPTYGMTPSEPCMHSNLSTKIHDDERGARAIEALPRSKTHSAAAKQAELASARASEHTRRCDIYNAADACDGRWCNSRNTYVIWIVREQLATTRLIAMRQCNFVKQLLLPNLFHPPAAIISFQLAWINQLAWAAAG